MKLLILLSVAVSCLAKSGEDVSDFGYTLTGGFLEFFLRLEDNHVPKCYEENKDKYEKAVIFFHEKMDKVLKNIQTSFKSDSGNQEEAEMALEKMRKISHGMKHYPNDLKKNIFNGHLKEGATIIWQKRTQIDAFYGGYKEHMKKIKKNDLKAYEFVEHRIQEVNDEVLKQCEKLSANVLHCLESRRLSPYIAVVPTFNEEEKS